jgi:hypothetical protein
MSEHCPARLVLSTVAVCAALLALTAAPRADFARPYTPVLNFVENLRTARIEGKMRASAGVATIAGKTMTTLFEHPDAPGDPLVCVTFPDLALPAVAAPERLVLRFFTAIREGFSPAENPVFDGVEFIVQVNGSEVFHTVCDAQQWSEHTVDLSALAGRTVTVAFLTSPRSNPAYDWAVWGAPELRIEGRPSEVKIAKVPFLRYTELMARPLPQRLAFRDESDGTWSVACVLERDLDLPCLVADAVRAGQAPPVPTAPAMAVGEGPDPANHTLVKVLNGYGLAELQFLAYAPEVTGGVAVEAGRFGDLGAAIVACPLSAKEPGMVRLFSRHGALLGQFSPEGVTAPFALTVGNFLPDHLGDEIALCPRQWGAEGEVRLLDAAGAVLARMPLTQTPGGPVELSARGGEVLVSFRDAGRMVRANFATRHCDWLEVPALPKGGAAYATVFDGAGLALTGPEQELSTLTVLDGAGTATVQDVGARENRFYLGGFVGADPDMPEGRYVKKCQFAHIRTDGSSPLYSDPVGCEQTPEKIAGPDFMARHARSLQNYNQDPPKMWEPCFTHRMFATGFAPWAEVKDPETGLPRYMALSRNDNTTAYGEFGRDADFLPSTYAFGLPALENLYMLPLRAFLRGLAPHFRENPEHFVCVEPNHEHEIAVERDGTIGDYNPRMIDGFFLYLRSVYGDDLDKLRQTLGLPEADFFDAPRQWDRGDWDATTPENPLFREWVAYNRSVICRRVAQTFREALLAGFPPEAITCHQIPDLYAIGDLKAFSKVVARITPVDWMLNSGVGYGFTRYGVWYNRPHDALQDANSSGFNMQTIGEYQALTPDAEAAYRQLRFIFERGGYGVHCMKWPAGFDKGYNDTMAQAARRLVVEERPRPGVTGGVGQLRPVQQGDRRFNIACIGTGDRTGLLKSLNADGTWEGSVYVVPFHAAVEVVALPDVPAELAAGERWTSEALAGLDSGCQVELSGWARAQAQEATLRIDVERDGVPLRGMAQDVKLGTQWRFVRFVFRCQVPVEGLRLTVSSDAGAIFRDLYVTRQDERTPKVVKGRFDGRAHRGGVTFAVLPQD